MITGEPVTFTLASGEHVELIKLGGNNYGLGVATDHGAAMATVTLAEIDQLATGLARLAGS